MEDTGTRFRLYVQPPFVPGYEKPETIRLKAPTGSILAGNLHGQPLPEGFVLASHADWLLLAAMGVVVFVLGLVTTSQWALGTAARTAALFGTGDPGTGEPRASGSLRLLPGDLPQGR